MGRPPILDPPARPPAQEFQKSPKTRPKTRPPKTRQPKACKPKTRLWTGFGRALLDFLGVGFPPMPISTYWVSKYVQKEDQHLQKESQKNGRKPAQEFQKSPKFWATFGRVLGDFLGGRVPPKPISTKNYKNVKKRQKISCKKCRHWISHINEFHTRKPMDSI